MSSRNHLVLLIAAPQPDEVAMLRDQAAMIQTQLARGFSTDEILCLHARLDRPLSIAMSVPAFSRMARKSAGLTQRRRLAHAGRLGAKAGRLNNFDISHAVNASPLVHGGEATLARCFEASTGSSQIRQVIRLIA